jgi:hypothetical protein
MRLEENVPGRNDTSRSTPLGKELNVDLLMVFMGLWCEWEIPHWLEEYALIDESQSAAMYDGVDN